MTGGFDVVLGLALLATAVGALASRELFRAIVMFIVFGLLMALAWVRLQAPDIALAEAAIGAGLTGVLLLDTLGYLRRRFERPRAQDTTPPAQSQRGRQGQHGEGGNP
ncbi:Na(+)/H(+) antiporter subunit B [Thauera sp. WH-1]|uniref:Na(+)/H(+) antiporter subunit B n=1 Tax=Thauera sp. WH-1 TaxID=3398230 RepID=UPI0039FC1495